MILLLGAGCGVSADDNERAYLFGYRATLFAWNGWITAPEDEVEQATDEDVAQACSIPSEERLLTLNRVESAQLGAFDACTLGNELGLDGDCEEASDWMQGSATEDFSGFVTEIGKVSGGCSASVEGWFADGTEWMN